MFLFAKYVTLVFNVFMAVKEEIILTDLPSLFSIIKRLLQKTVDLVTFTEEILNEKLHFFVQWVELFYFIEEKPGGNDRLRT